MPAPVINEYAINTQTVSRFHKAISTSKAEGKYGAAVYVYDKDDYRDMRLFLTEDGKSGFALKDDGDLVSVFTNGGGKVHAMIELGVQQDATKLDAFDTILPELCELNGFYASSNIK